MSWIQTHEHSGECLVIKCLTNSPLCEPLRLKYVDIRIGTASKLIVKQHFKQHRS